MKIIKRVYSKEDGRFYIFRLLSCVISVSIKIGSKNIENIKVYKCVMSTLHNTKLLHNLETPATICTSLIFQSLKQRQCKLVTLNPSIDSSTATTYPLHGCPPKNIPKYNQVL